MRSVASRTESVAACRLDTGRKWVAHELSGLLYTAGCCVPPMTLAHTGDLAMKTSGNRMCSLSCSGGAHALSSLRGAALLLCEPTATPVVVTHPAASCAAYCSSSLPAPHLPCICALSFHSPRPLNNCLCLPLVHGRYKYTYTQKLTECNAPAPCHCAHPHSATI